MLSEDWDLLVSFFPSNWKWLATRTKALKGLHGCVSPASAIRVLLMHVASGYSLRETAVRAHASNIANLSDVAILKRLRKSKEWFRQLCLCLFKERGMPLGRIGGRQIRAFDATTVREPGKTGSVWRIHYSVRLPALTCDFFKITETAGAGTGESFRQFPVAAGDYILADRGYSTGPGIHYATSQHAYACVRVNSQSLLIVDSDGNPFPLVERLKTVTKTGEIACWTVGVLDQGSSQVEGRLCVLRKSKTAINAEIRRLKRIANKKGLNIKPDTFVIAEYVIIFTTFPPAEFTPQEVLQWYRLRWQVELVFKRFKQIAQLGHLPKSDSDSSQAWLYGKLFVALMTEKMISYARALSPWGYGIEEAMHSESVA